MRIAQILFSQGFGTRRDCSALVQRGDVSVAGRAVIDADEEMRCSAYRALFRSELDDAAVAEIRLALAQSQPLGESRFAEAICKAAVVVRIHGVAKQAEAKCARP